MGLAEQTVSNWGYWILLLLPYLLAQLVQYLKQTYQQASLATFLKRCGLLFGLPILALTVIRPMGQLVCA